MSSNSFSTQDQTSPGPVVRAEPTTIRADQSTAVSSGSERVVVTRQQSGEVKLRYAPRGNEQANQGVTIAQ
jgi:hypothetical protein